MRHAGQRAGLLAGGEQQLGVAAVDAVPRHVAVQVQAEDVAVVGGVFHAVDAADGGVGFGDQLLHDAVAGDGVVVGEGEGVHVFAEHDVQQLGAGDARVGLGGVVVQFKALQHGKPPVIRRARSARSGWRLSAR